MSVAQKLGPTVIWGRNSVVLAIAIGNGVVLAALLWRAGAYRPFLLPLAGLVALISLRLVPYAIGFAGAYDTYHWLTFAPFDFSMAFGPLVWMYVVRLATGAWPPRWPWHLVPVLLQLIYQLGAFSLPLDAKWNWYTGIHREFIEPIGFVAVVASLVAYVVAASRRFVAWTRDSDDRRSNLESSRRGVVRVVLVGTAAVAMLAALFAVRSLFIAPTDYFDRFPMILALAILAYVLGLAGWRQSAMDFPVVTRHAKHLVGPTNPPVAPAAPGRPQQDYAALGADWRQRTVSARWYRESALTLPEFAGRLGVSPRTASRVLRDGLGLTFNEFVNGLRVEDVRQRLSDAEDTRNLLPIALEAGFASKASFNRAFRKTTGASPSAMRTANTD